MAGEHPCPYPNAFLFKKTQTLNSFIIVNLETIVGDLMDVEPIQAGMQMWVQMAWGMI